MIVCTPAWLTGFGIICVFVGAGLGAMFVKGPWLAHEQEMKLLHTRNDDEQSPRN